MSSGPGQMSGDRAELKGILEGDEYQQYVQSQESSWWEWLQPLLRKLKSYFPQVDLPPGAGRWVTYGLLLLLLGMAAFAVYWFARQLIRQNRLRSSAFLPGGEEARSSTDYWYLAAELASAGQWREGVRALFLSLVFYLDRQEHIRLQPWKTNWEYEEELARRAPDLKRIFHDCSQLFERIWYGREGAEQEGFRAIRDQVERVIRTREEAKDAEMG